jgi:hypothetical protein
MPSACGITGIVFGLSLALFLPYAREAVFSKRLEAAAGMALGAVSMAAMRCSGLFQGEAIGLLAGLFAGVVAAGIARAWIDRRRARVA